MKPPTTRLLWSLVLRALAVLIYRQAFPDWKDHDRDWERKANRLTTELEGMADELEDREARIPE